MKVWMFVEGDSDSLGLKALFDNWIKDLNANGWGIRIVPLKNKSRYFEFIGISVTDKLMERFFASAQFFLRQPSTAGGRSRRHVDSQGSLGGKAVLCVSMESH